MFTIKIQFTDFAKNICSKHILTNSAGIDPDVLQKITDYTMLFWGNQGNHHTFNSHKFIPTFTREELKAAVAQALRNGASDTIEKEARDLDKTIFDPDFQPMLTMKNPKNGEDPLQASSNNYYSGVTLKGFGEFHGTLSAEFAAGKKERQVGRRNLSRGHSGRKNPAGALRQPA